MKTVLVAFEVDADSDEQAQQILSERLAQSITLGHNDSMDYVRGTQDRLNTYAIVPVRALLDEAL